jgi:predicted ATP-binding protein involved in virulence
MATVGVGRDFVFIDEPEISLNLRWQREILGIIEEILPNTQIIVASHSQAITQDPGALCKMKVGQSDGRG